jgi:hypothetical protein
VVFCVEDDEDDDLNLHGLPALRFQHTHPTEPSIAFEALCPDVPCPPLDCGENGFEGLRHANSGRDRQRHGLSIRMVVNLGNDDACNRAVGFELPELAALGLAGRAIIFGILC